MANRIVKLASKIADKKYYGDEPIVKGKLIEGIHLINVYNWYNYMCDINHARAYIIDYFEQKNEKKNVELIKKLPDHAIILHAGWISRILTRGGILSQTSIDNFNAYIAKMLQKAEFVVENKNENKNENKINFIQKSNSLETCLLMIEINELIDKKDFSGIENLFKQKNFSKQQLQYALNHIKEICDEIRIACFGDNKISQNELEQIKEAYSIFSKKELLKEFNFHESIKKLLLEKLNSRPKIIRKRKNKITQEKILKAVQKFKYMKMSQQFKIQSLSPADIIGAKSAWLYNTKYNTFTVYNSQEDNSQEDNSQDGLNIKGCTILNYDEKTSKTYYVGSRKNKEFFAKYNSCKNPSMSMLVSNYSTRTLQQRGTDDTLILKVFK